LTPEEKQRIEDIKKDLTQRIDQVQDYTEGIHTSFENWADTQDQKMNNFIDKIYDKLDKINDTMTRKTEMDSAIISQLQGMLKRIEKVEDIKDGHDKYITQLNVKVDHLINIMSKHSIDKMNQDIGEAHTRLRDHEDRIRPLELARGKQAIKILWYILTLLAGSAVGILVTYLPHIIK